MKRLPAPSIGPHDGDDGVFQKIDCEKLNGVVLCTFPRIVKVQSFFADAAAKRAIVPALWCQSRTIRLPSGTMSHSLDDFISAKALTSCNIVAVSISFGTFKFH
jgi:hypothetical protein